jgi:hypothetical protein
MPENIARGIGIDFGAGGCRLAVQAESSREVCSVSLGRGAESPKRHIGMQRPGNDARATELLRATREEGERVLGAKITGGMLAVPPCFTDRQKSAAQACAVAAGFKNVGLIDESVAGAVFHVTVTGQRGRWLVYGLGKSTFYTTLIDTREKIDVKGHNGDVQIGGGDIDTLLASELRQRGLVGVGLDPDMLLRLAERCKKLLSFQEEAIIQDLGGPADKPVCFTFRRYELEALLEVIVGKTISLVRQTLAEEKTSAGEIDRVLLLGESTRIPLVQRRLGQEISAPSERLSGDAVCRGAAIVGTRLGDCFQDIVEPGLEAQATPAAEGPLTTYAAMNGAEGAEKLDLYYQFLEHARNELAYLCKQEAARQAGRDRAKDAVTTLERFLEWKTTAGKDVVKAKLADFYFMRARNAYAQALAAKRDDERRKALKDCKTELNKCLESNSGHAEAKGLRARLPR